MKLKVTVKLKFGGRKNPKAKYNFKDSKQAGQDEYGPYICSSERERIRNISTSRMSASESERVRNTYTARMRATTTTS